MLQGDRRTVKVYCNFIGRAGTAWVRSSASPSTGNDVIVQRRQQRHITACDL